MLRDFWHEIKSEVELHLHDLSSRITQTDRTNVVSGLGCDDFYTSEIQEIEKIRCRLTKTDARVSSW